MEDVERIGIEEAKQRLDDGWSYIDVRTPEEYDAGHPAGALNIPWTVRDEGRIVPNQDFLAVVRACFSVADELVIGCATGRRSLAAARQLREAGFARVVDMRPGYDGIRDPFGQVKERGWAAAGLSTELVTKDGSWDALRGKLG
jgi:rhodanese-related sulfurtransferase